MGSAGLAHAPLREETPDFVYNRHNDGGPGNAVTGDRRRLIQSPRSLHRLEEGTPQSAEPQPSLSAQLSAGPTSTSVRPAYFRGSKYDRSPYWQNIRRWKDVSEADFLSYRWNVSLELHKHTSYISDMQLDCQKCPRKGQAVRILARRAA